MKKCILNVWTDLKCKNLPVKTRVSKAGWKIKYNALFPEVSKTHSCTKSVVGDVFLLSNWMKSENQQLTPLCNKNSSMGLHTLSKASLMLILTQTWRPRNEKAIPFFFVFLIVGAFLWYQPNFKVQSTGEGPPSQEKPQLKPVGIESVPSGV